MQVKGNNGKGARRKLLQKLYVIICILSVTCIVLFGLLQKNNYANGPTTNHHHSILPDSLNPRRILNKKQQLKRRLPQMRHPAPAAAAATNHDRAWDDIMNAHLHLVELGGLGSSTTGGRRMAEITAAFCRLEWNLHKEQPSSYPMFRDLVAASPSCVNKVYFKFQDVVAKARSYDAQQQQHTNVLDLTAVVFHESRCGSTLTANLLATWRPEEHRVYSESTPPIQALHQVCGDNYEYCTVETAAAMLRDVVYLMSRSDDVRERRVFFKIQSAGTRNIEVFQTAFPNVPYLFVYRDPVQVMMSQLAHGVHNANCVRDQNHPPKVIRRILQKYGEHETPEDFCAAHLASITERVIDSYTKLAIPVNYRDMPNILFDSVFPEILHVPEIAPPDLRRMKETALVYSKGRGESNKLFSGDSQQKEAAANERVRAAVDRYLVYSYSRLEEKAAARIGRGDHHQDDAGSESTDDEEDEEGEEEEGEEI